MVVVLLEVEDDDVVLELVVLLEVVDEDVELDDGVGLVDDVVRGTVVDVVDDVVVVGVTVLSSVALPIATPIPAPASSRTNAIPHTPAGLMPPPLSALRAGPLGPRSARI